MKDLEKIKSEDLGCQVADANPGNFAIEQEVAQLVGATVPAPTEPSDDDARELGAQLLVFLRRALLPIRSALRTALAAIYSHLDSRCTDYTPAAYASFTPTHHAYDPMGSTPRTLPNLLTAITAFAPRKISNGSATNDGIPDGVSLAHLLCGAYNDVTELTDDNDGWSFGSYTKVNAIASLFPNAAKITMNGIIRSISGRMLTSAVVNELNLRGVQATYLRVRDEGMFLFNGTQEDVTVRFGWIDQTRTSNDDVWIFGGNMTKVHFLIPKFVTDWHTRLVNNGLVEEFDMSETTEFYNNYGGMVYSAVEASCNALKTFKFGTLTRYSPLSFNSYYNCPNLIDLQVGQGTCCNLDFSSWNPTDKGTTFLQNFKEHIALRLTDQGSGKTLTLSQAVRDAIHAAEATYGIEAIIVTQKGWTLSPAPGASSQ